MKKIYRFESLNQLAITVDEYQSEPEVVMLRVHVGEEILHLQFDKAEFLELCNMKYRMDFPSATSQPLSLVAA